MMKKNITLVALSVIFLYRVVGQTVAPEITQVVVNETGGVTLTWTPNTIAADFDHSEVWYQQVYVPEFFKIPDSESSDYTSNFYEHHDAQANSRLTSYYVANYDRDLNTMASDVINTIYLTACFTIEKIQLSWNHIHPLWTEHAFHIYRRTGDNTTWEFLSSTHSTTFQDDPIPFVSCSYRVYYKDASDPTASASNITPPISNFERQPITPSITSIEVFPEGTTAIEWERSPSINVADYIVYRSKAAGGWEELGKTGSPDVFNWIHKQTTFDNCTEPRTYAIAALDVCGEVGTYPDSCKSTLILHEPKYKICDDEIKLIWEPYGSMQVDRYEILVSDDNGENFEKYTSSTADVTEYSFTDLKSGHYCFKISAVHNRGEDEKPQTITSCQYCLDAYFPPKPKPAFFRFVSVIDRDIQICFEVDASDRVSKYQIERSSTGIDGPYEVIETLTPTGGTVICTVDTDQTLKTQNLSYHYRLSTLDSCHKAFPAEKTAQSILLKAKEDPNTHANLEWNTYDGFQAEIDHYIVRRYINEEIDREFITTSTSYNDTDLRLMNLGFLFSYRITAVSSPSFTNIRDTAYSNIAPLRRLKSDIWFPNAFTPAGNNKIFRPIYGNEIEVETYELTIFDRYGAVIFRTTEPKGGWNGRISGSIASAGGYGYMLKITTKAGDRIERRGSMLLIN